MSLPQRLLTGSEYLAIERQAEHRSEFFEGERFALAGASQRHNLLVANLVRVLGNQLVNRRCNVYPSDLRIKIEALGKYTYPDVSVACAEETFEDSHRDVLLNPVVIFEVLSDSTEAYDRGRKFEHYQHLDSLREYLLVTQNRRRIEHFVRQGSHRWTYTDHGPGPGAATPGSIRLPSIDCSLELDDVYAKTPL